MSLVYHPVLFKLIIFLNQSVTTSGTQNRRSQLSFFFFFGLASTLLFFKIE